MAQPELAWSTRGFCGYTNIGEGSACEATDRKGHWEVGGYITPSGFLYACLSMCKKCERCNYISVSHKAADCSWYHSCELQGSKHVELVRHSYQVRQHGAVVGRVERLLQRHVQNTSFESEGIRLVSVSPAAVCFGAQCVSWAAAGAASRGPGGWVGALPSRVSVEAQASCGIRNDCRPQQTCGRCIDEAATKGAVFERTLALQAKQTRLITQHTLKAWSERDAKLNRRYKKGLVSTLTQWPGAWAALLGQRGHRRRVHQRDAPWHLLSGEPLVHDTCSVNAVSKSSNGVPCGVRKTKRRLRCKESGRSARAVRHRWRSAPRGVPFRHRTSPYAKRQRLCRVNFKRGPWCWPGAMSGAWSLALSLLLAHLAPTSVKRVG